MRLVPSAITHSTGPSGPRSRLARRALLVFLVALSATPPSASAEDDALDLSGVELPSLVRGAISFYNEHAKDPLAPLNHEQIEDLARHKVVVLRRKEGRGENSEDLNWRVFGYLLIPQSLKKVWLAGMHPEYVRSDAYVLVRYSEDGRGGSTAYMYVHAPWPVTDRQTAIVAVMSREMAEASNGFVWEQRWDIARDQQRIAEELVDAGKVQGVDPDMVQGAVWLPVNYGSFALFRFGDELTLLGWSVTTSVGGHIPDALVSAFAAEQLKGSLKELEKRASWIEDVYAADELPIYDVYGEVIPTAATRGGAKAGTGSADERP